MTRSKKRILIVPPPQPLFVPAAAFADIVFDPTNFAEAVIQVADDVQMVDQLHQEVTNEVAMLKSWNFTQLPGILQSMNVWQQVFGQAGTTYSSTDPGNTLNSQYPSDPSSYANMSDANYPVDAKWLGSGRAERPDRKPHRPERDVSEPATDRAAHSILCRTFQFRVRRHLRHASRQRGSGDAGGAAPSAPGPGNHRRPRRSGARCAGSGGTGIRRAAAPGGSRRLDNPQQPTTSLVDAFPTADQ